MMPVTIYEGAAGFGSVTEDTVDTIAGTIYLATPFVAGYAARKHGFGWPATIGIAIGADILFTIALMVAGPGGFLVPGAAVYYAVKG